MHHLFYKRKEPFGYNLTNRYKERSLRVLIFTLIAFIFTACGEDKSYSLLYPIEASKQSVSLIEGYRFLSSETNSPFAVIVLSNPVENGSYADLAFAISNRGDKPISIDLDDIIVKMRGAGELRVSTKRAYAHAKPYKRPESFESLSPKMQAFGCAAANTKDNIGVSSFNEAQSWVWNRHKEYPFIRPELYLEALTIPSGQTKGVLFRIQLPEMDKSFDQSTILIQIKTKKEEEELYRFKLVLQSLS